MKRKLSKPKRIRPKLPPGIYAITYHLVFECEPETGPTYWLEM